MAKLYKVRATVKDILKGKCSQGHKVGETWLIEKDGKTPGGMCPGAYNSLAPSLRTFRFGGEHHFDQKDVTYISCPDPKHFVIFEVRRLR